MHDEMNQILTPAEIQEIESMGVTLNSELLDPKVDIVFKAILASQRPESKKALIHLLSAALRRNITSVSLLNNELANTGILQKQSVFDIHVSFDEGDEAEIEIQMALSDNLVSRSEYNTAKLFCSQSIKGKPYADLKKVYTVIIMNFTLFEERKDFYDDYMYRNAEGKVLSGNTKIVYIELTKLGDVEKKSVSEMTGIEKWALFLKYANHKGKQDLIQRIIKSEEGRRMGAEILETISKDREEFSRYYHYLKAEIDRESQLITAHRKGIAQGTAQGIAQGIAQGKIEGAISIIKELKTTVSKAMEIIKLPEERRTELIQELENQRIQYMP
jgi:predicted transposase/invertase (TIGR01784 family)